jgi:hypothetical protein
VQEKKGVEKYCAAQIKNDVLFKIFKKAQLF